MNNTISEEELFAKNLAKIRKLKGFTQQELADKIGTSQRIISHYESNVKSPSLKYIIRIADALQISIDTLLRSNSIKNEFDTRIAKRIKLIESLSERDQKAIWSLVNALVAKRNERDCLNN